MRKFVFIFISFLFVSNMVDAAVLPNGCRVPTALDQRGLAARGLPITEMICKKDIQALGLIEFDRWFDKLKRTSPCNKSKATLSYRTKNTGAQVCGTISRKWGAIGCHRNNNTAIFPTIERGFAAHVDLTKRFCTVYKRCTIIDLVDRWTSVAKDRPGYVRSLSNWTGIPSRQRFDPNDCEIVGRIALASSCFEAGSLPYSKNQIKRGLAMACGGKIPPPSQFQPNPSLNGNNNLRSTPRPQPAPAQASPSSPAQKLLNTPPPSASPTQQKQSKPVRNEHPFSHNGKGVKAYDPYNSSKTDSEKKDTSKKPRIASVESSGSADPKGRSSRTGSGGIVSLIVSDKKTVKPGERLTITWASLRADMCRAVGPGVRHEARLGRVQTPVISARYLRGKTSLEYIVVCINKKGITKKSVRIAVGESDYI